MTILTDRFRRATLVERPSLPARLRAPTLHTSFGHKRSTLTSVLDRLEQRGWVRRGSHPTSRRLVMIHLANEGRRVGERVAMILRGVEDGVATRTGHGDIEAFLRVIGAIGDEVG